MGDTMYVRVMFFDLKIYFNIKTACFEIMSFTDFLSLKYINMLYFLVTARYCF